MKFTDIFIRRPVIAIVVNIVIVIAGLQAIRSISVRQYPRNENATITITTAYVGANADLVRGFITTPIERAISAVDGIDYVSSQSQQSVSIIHANLRLNYDSIRALSEISAKVDQVRGELPPGSEIPVLNIESIESQYAAAYLSFSSEFLNQSEITDYLSRIVEPKLSAINGVQRSEIIGSRKFAMRIWLDPELMAAHMVTPADVQRVLTANNYLSAAGETKGSLIRINMTANTDLQSVQDFSQLIVRDKDSAIVRLKDIATVELGAEDYDQQAAASGQSAVFIGIFALPNANTVDVIKAVRKDMESIQKELPAQIQGKIVFDGTKYIVDAIKEVIGTLAETLVVVIFVIYLFLGSLRSAIVPIVTIPISLIGSVFLMQIFGFTLNLLTLLAIVLSVGLVVDDAIVVVENVERHIREGMSRTQAAIVSARELVSPVIAMTITLAAVYIPIAFQGGLTGSLFREFALTLAGSVMISGIVALTLSPVMSASTLRTKGNENRFKIWIDRVFQRLRLKYDGALDTVLHTRKALYISWVILSACGFLMFSMSSQELAPMEDQGVIFGIVQMPPSATMEQITPFTDRIYQEAIKPEEAEYTFQVTSPSFGFWGVILKPWFERERTTADVLLDLRKSTSGVPGIQTFPILPAALPGGGAFPVELVISSTANTTQILEFAKELQQRATDSGLFAFEPTIDVKIDQLESELQLDREKIAELGLDLQSVGQHITAATGGNYVNRFSISGQSYKVIPQLQRNSRLNPEQLQDIYISNSTGDLIPLRTVATLKERVSPRSLNRFQQLNSVTLSGVPIVSLDQALSFLEQEAAEILPQNYSVDYTGESRQLRKEENTFLPAFCLAIVLIFLVLAAQFNSFRDPLIILGGSVPLAMFGASIFTFLRMPNPNIPFFTSGWTTTLNIYSQVGLVTLIGLVSKNGILIVEFANVLQREGQSKFEAIKAASSTRLRPILMTSMATVFGHLPLTFVAGPGAAARNSIGLVLVGGMAIGTFFTLFLVPAIYLLIARDHKAVAQKQNPTGEEPDPHMPQGPEHFQAQTS